jgi:hypothetical protein
MPAAKNPNPAKKLFRALTAIGVREAYLRQVALPEWWDDEIADTPAGRDELHLILSRVLGLDAVSLRAGKPRFLPQPVPKFKAAKGLDGEAVAMARQIAVHVARLVAAGVTNPVSVPSSAAEARAAILKQRPWVDLEGLLDFCWQRGIGVVHVAKLPPNSKKMAALVASIGDRPVVVVADNHKATAWSLFILAHEIGHIVSGHVPVGALLVDAEIDKVSRDHEEAEANRFAVELLTGDEKTRVMAVDRLPRAADLAASARRFGAERGIDPGHFVLNYAASMGDSFWGVANAALRLIEPDADAAALIRHKLHENLDWSKLPSTSAEFVLRVVGAEKPAA